VGGVQPKALALVFVIVILGIGLLSGVRWATHNLRPPSPYIIWAILLIMIALGLLFRDGLDRAIGWTIEKTIRLLFGSEEKEE
jgi:hypothetical protein